MFKNSKGFVQLIKMPLLLITGVILLIWYGSELKTTLTSNARHRQQVVCPSLLSIARSPRDTMIIMKNEPLCNRYVLDNLK